MADTQPAAGSGAAAVRAKPRALVKQSTRALLAPAENAYGVVSAASLAKPYDVVVIGGGPAGVAAAQKAAFLGRRAILIDNAQCPPNDLDLTFGAPTGLFSKALRDTAKTLDTALLERMGLDSKVVWAQVQSSVARLAANNAHNAMSMLSELRVDYLRARATIESGECVLAALPDGSEVRIQTGRILMATGSKPLRPESVPFDDKRVFDSDSIAHLAFLPRSVVVAGAGIIAIEYAKIFSKLGCSVTMLVRGEAKSSLSRIGLDEAIAQGLLDDLDSSGVRVLTNTSADVFDVPEALDQPLTIGLKSNAKDAANAEPPADLECDLFLAAMGRRPTVCDGLAEIGGVVDPKGGAVRVSASFAVEGAPPTVYAAGDLIGAPALASTGVEQAKAAVSAMFAESEADRASVGRDNFPVGVWTIPEIGYYGLTKAAALKQGLQAEEGVAPYTSCLRGRVFAPQGFLKLVFDRSDGRVVGVHILGTDACELIHYGMELINGKRTIFDVMSTLFTAVTFHELFKAAALDANSKLEFGVQWRGILKELGDSFRPDDAEGVKAKFVELDADGSGELDATELMACFKSLGKEVSLGTVTNMVRLADADGSGSIGLEELMKVLRAV